MVNKLLSLAAEKIRFRGGLVDREIDRSIRKDIYHSVRMSGEEVMIGT